MSDAAPASPSPASISAVVPVFNSEQSLQELVSRLERALSAHAREFEIILVNDGSRDRSWEVIRELTGAHPRVRGIDLMRNFGQHNALLSGIRAARHEWIVTLDDDLQNPPEEMPKLLAKLSEGFDVVYGPPERERHNLWRALASRLTKAVLQRAMGADTARKISAFRAFRTQIREAFVDFDGPFVSIDVLLTWGTTRFAAVPVRQDARAHGVSQYTAWKLVTHALDLFTGFTVRPLQWAGWIGFGFTLFGVGILAYVVGRYVIQGTSVPGFPFLASIIAIFSGAQLFALGIIGEYLARMHFRMMQRPSYVVRRDTSASHS